MAKHKPAGWKGESLRHSLAARGFETTPPKGILIDLTGDSIETFSDMKRLEPSSEEEQVRNAERLVGEVVNDPEIQPILDRAKDVLQSAERNALAKRGIQDDYDFLMEELSFSLLDIALEMDVAIDGMVSPSDREAGVKAAKSIIEAIKKANNWEF